LNITLFNINLNFHSCVCNLCEKNRNFQIKNKSLFIIFVTIFGYNLICNYIYKLVLSFSSHNIQQQRLLEHRGLGCRLSVCACPENWSTRKGGQRGKLVNAEKWSTRKGGQRKSGQREESAKMPSFGS
jgi:hypothetical protein